MRAVLLFTLAAALCVAVGWWVADLPGNVSATIGTTTLKASAPVALTLAALLFGALYVLFRLVGLAIRAPRLLRRRRRDSDRRRGDGAVSRALVALAANDADAARQEAARSRTLLGDTPLTLLLAAQASRQAGRDDEAREMFKLLAARPDAKLLGLRGLLRQAAARQDWTEAAALAQQAEAAHPGAAWLTEERRNLALKTGQWREALRLTPPARGDGADPGARAALGVAAAEHEPDADAALRLAKQAWEADPTLAPAALAYVKRLRAIKREKVARDVLRRSWGARPHPDLAEAYLAPIADKMARVRSVQGLVAANPSDPDSLLLRARVALEAGLTGQARQHAEAAKKAGFDGRRLWTLLADIAAADGDAEAGQAAMRAMPHARPDPAWRCLACGASHPEWQAVCDGCGTPGRVDWTEAEVQQAPRALTSPAVIEGLS